MSKEIRYAHPLFRYTRRDTHLDTFIKLTRCTNSLLARLAERNTVGDLTYSQFAVLEASITSVL